MRSALPKPLHRICGRPMVLHVIAALAELDVERVVVVIGHAADEVRAAIEAEAPAGVTIDFALQEHQQGTGDAVSVGLAALPSAAIEDDEDDVIVLPGDTPLLRSSTLVDLVTLHRERGAGATLLTARLKDPTGYGRVVRGRAESVVQIVEHGDATSEQRAIDEINPSIYCFRRSPLAPALRRLSPQNAQGEYYLTDVVSVFHDAGYPTGALVAADPMEASGVNDRVQLAEAETELRRRINEGWMRSGVTMRDPSTTYIDVDVVLEPDVVLLPGVMLSGETVVAAGSVIGPACQLDSCSVGRRARVEVVVARDAMIGDESHVGPFVLLDPGSDVSAGGHVGPRRSIDG